MAVLKGKVNGQWQEIGAAYYQKFYPDEWLFKDGTLNLDAYGNLLPADKYLINSSAKRLQLKAETSVYFENPITKSFAKIKIVVADTSSGYLPKLKLGSTPTGGEYYDYALHTGDNEISLQNIPKPFYFCLNDPWSYPPKEIKSITLE